MKNITYCYVDGSGKEQVNSVSDNGGDAGYSLDERAARIWMHNDNGQETLIIPLDRVVFIRYTTIS